VGGQRSRGQNSVNNGFSEEAEKKQATKGEFNKIPFLNPSGERKGPKEGDWGRGKKCQVKYDLSKKKKKKGRMGGEKEVIRPGKPVIRTHT